MKLPEIVAESTEEKERDSAATVITDYIDVNKYGLLYDTDHVVQKYNEKYGRILQLCPVFRNMSLKYMQKASLKVILVDPTCRMPVVSGLVLASVYANQEWIDFTGVMANAFVDINKHRDFIICFTTYCFPGFTLQEHKLFTHA